MNWENIIREEQQKNYFQKINELIKLDRQNYDVYPPNEDVFNAFKLCSFEQTKVVILGMDPYHNYGEAHGLSFSVLPGIKTPPSLRNIFKEIESDLGIKPPNNGCLIDWAKQGVLLLNAALTVRKNEPGSHQNIGWNIFTDRIISELNNKEAPVVFILWGAFAKKKSSLITNKHHLILQTSHPSFFSVNKGFFGCKHFSKTNEFLNKNNLSPIDWCL